MPEPTLPAISTLLGLARSAWSILSAGAKWLVAPWRNVGGVTIPTRTFVAMPAPMPEPLWWRATTLDDREAMEICCWLQITNVCEYGVRVSGVKIVKPKGQVHRAMIATRDLSGDARTIIPRGAIATAHCTAWIEPRHQAIGEPITVDLDLYDQFNNRHKVRGLTLRGIG